MNKKHHSPQDFQTDFFDLSTSTNKMTLLDIFRFNNASEICHTKLFVAHFNKIPNYIVEEALDVKKAHQWFMATYEKSIVDVYFNKRFFHRNKRSEFEDIFYFLLDDLIINFDMQQECIRFLFRKTSFSEVEKIVTEFKKFRMKRKRKPEISLLVYSNSDIRLTRLKIPKPKLTLEDNYNDDFIPIHQTIVSRLKKKNDKGLVLLHGKPGTGKTSYIRYLINQLKKDVIFLPPSMAPALTNPELISTLIENPNSIFIIEDAENIVLDREATGNSSVSTLLNLSDGLLSDCLNIQIICTFNIDVSKIDNALLRKGRLIAKYHFENLEMDKANRLSDKLGFETKFTTAMPLSMIYNQTEKNYQNHKKISTIGFQTVN